MPVEARGFVEHVDATGIAEDAEAEFARSGDGVAEVSGLLPLGEQFDIGGEIVGRLGEAFVQLPGGNVALGKNPCDLEGGLEVVDPLADVVVRRELFGAQQVCPSRVTFFRGKDFDMFGIEIPAVVPAAAGQRLRAPGFFQKIEIVLHRCCGRRKRTAGPTEHVAVELIQQLIGIEAGVPEELADEPVFGAVESPVRIRLGIETIRAAFVATLDVGREIPVVNARDHEAFAVHVFVDAHLPADAIPGPGTFAAFAGE